MLLTFDTCLDKTYVALANDTQIIESRIVDNKETTYHSAYLISTIKEILNNNNVKPNDIKVVATDVGPGSFTGIRACMTVAKVMTQQLNIKAIGLSSLEILSKLNENNKTLVLLDARKNKAYVWDKEILGAIDIENVREMVKSSDYSIICDESMFNIFSEYTSNIKIYNSVEHNFAEIMADIIINNPERFKDYKHELKPLYIQPPPIFGK